MVSTDVFRFFNPVNDQIESVKGWFGSLSNSDVQASIYVALFPRFVGLKLLRQSIPFPLINAEQMHTVLDATIGHRSANLLYLVLGRFLIYQSIEPACFPRRCSPNIIRNLHARSLKFPSEGLLTLTRGFIFYKIAMFSFHIVWSSVKILCRSWALSR